MNGGADHQSSQRLPMSNTEMPTTPPPGGVATASVSMAAPNAPPRDVNLNAGSGGAALVRAQDHFLPMTNVTRIMRKVLPAYAKISDDAKETIQECVSEYISFITSEANERCQLEQRRTITADDMLSAMRKLGFDDYVEPLSLYLSRYREIEGDHSGSRRGNQLPPLTRFHSQISTATTNYGDVPSSASPPPTLAPNQMPQLPHGEYADEDGSGAGSSSSWRGNSMGGGFDHSGSFK